MHAVIVARVADLYRDQDETRNMHLAKRLKESRCPCGKWLTEQQIAYGVRTCAKCHGKRRKLARRWA
jgi:hypothetical protein